MFVVKIRTDSWNNFVNEVWLSSPAKILVILFHKFVAGMRFACILIIEIVSAGRFYVDIEQSLGSPRSGRKKSRCFFGSLIRKV